MLFNFSSMVDQSGIESTSLNLGERTPAGGAGEAGPAELLVIEGENRGARVALANAITRVGRRSENGLVLSSKGVSRFHCQVIREEGRYLIEDLDSLHGTFQNGRRLPPRKPQPLRHGDRLRIVDQVLLFHHPGGDGTRDGLASIRLDAGNVAAEASEVVREMPGLKKRGGRRRAGG